MNWKEESEQDMRECKLILGLVFMVCVYLGFIYAISTHNDPNIVKTQEAEVKIEVLDTKEVSPEPQKVIASYPFKQESSPSARKAVNKWFDGNSEAKQRLQELVLTDEDVEKIENATLPERKRAEQAREMWGMVAKDVKERKEAAGLVEPWNNGIVPHTNRGEWAFSTMTKRNGTIINHHVIVRTNDDPVLEMVVNKYLDAADELSAARLREASKLRKEQK